MKHSGIVLALLSAVAWAFWGFFSKLSTNHGVPPVLLAFLSSGVSFVLITLSYVWHRPSFTKMSWGLVFALLCGLCGALGVLLFAQAIKLEKAAIIVTVSAIYPALTVVLSFVLLREQISFLNVFGLLLVTLGVICVAR
jgi:transporter family protein